MSTTSGNSSIFNGGSRYSSDFQSVIDRAVGIASFSLVSLTAGKARLSAQSTALGSLDSSFGGLQSAIANLETATGPNSLNTSVSNGTIVKAVASSGATEGTYTIEVTDLGAYTNTLSKNGLTTVTDPSTQNISADSSFTVTIDGADTTITPASNTLSALVAAINATSSLGVRASIVNIGNSGSPDYRLSLQSSKLDAVTVSLTGGATPLLDTLATGALATYKVNGLATSITTDSRTITLGPGLSVDLLKQSEVGDATTITVARGTTSISNALSGFVTAYNAAAAEVAKHRGGAGGALAGQSILSTLTSALRSLSSYSDSSFSLTELGLEFNDQGVLTFDAGAFSTATNGKITSLLDFLGTPTGTGFLKSATDTLTSLEDSTEGALKISLTSVNDQITTQDKRITTEQERVDNVRVSLQARIAAADALIASLEQQVVYITGLFKAFTERPS